MVPDRRQCVVNDSAQTDDLWDLYEVQDDPDAVPEGTDVNLDTIPQGSYPSPNYESETSEAVNHLDPYLSPRAEEMMDFSPRPESAGTKIGPDSCPEVDDIGLVSVSFDDLLDDEYGMPVMLAGTSSPIDDDIDQEIEKYMSKASPKDDVTLKSLFGSMGDGSLKDELDVCKTPTSENSSDEEPLAQAHPNTKYSFRQRPVTVKDNTNALVIKGGDPLPTGKGRSQSNIVVVRQVADKSKPVSVVASKPVSLRETIEKSRNQTRVVSPISSTMSCTSGDYYEDDAHDKSKGAIQARLNRQKKKAYVNTLEKQVGDLSKENKQLTSQTSQLKKTVDSLEQEVCYLRRVLTNDSALANMIEGLHGSPSLSLTSSFEKDRKRKSSGMDHDYGRPAKHGRKLIGSATSGGICLHVEQNNVSLEFCSKCARMAREREP